ncbi:hypothetical protein ACQ4PT_000750 [Festuca glaucescens]
MLRTFLPLIAGEIWVTPPFSSPCFSPPSVGSMLSFFFCDASDRLRTEPASPDVFHVVVASPAVASFLLRAGPKHCARFGLGFHASLASASVAAAKLSDSAPPVSLRRRPCRRKPSWSRPSASSVGFGEEGLLLCPRALSREELPPSTGVPSAVPSSLKENASSPLLAPYAGVPRPAHPSLEPNAAPNGCPGSPAAPYHDFIAPTSPAPMPRSYMDAARSPPIPTPASPEPPFQTVSLDGCFRCLSIFHQVRTCRDPIRCRNCGRSGHRKRECTMPRPLPTFVPLASTPRANAAPPRQAPTPYPSALARPMSPSSSPRRARSSSPTRHLKPLFEVGESSSSSVPIPATVRVLAMVEPSRSEPEVPPEPLADEEEEVESDDDSAVPPPEVFMPPGDMDAARHMAIVYIDNLAPFSSPAGAIAEAIFNELPGLHVSMVGSSIGVMYAKFLSPEDRELAMLHQPFHLDGATFRLVCEEDADRIPCDMQWVALVLARRVGVEHLSQLNVHVAFSCFGETLEVDATTLSGADCSVVRAVVRLKHARWVPTEVLLTRKPWGSRLITLRKVRVWPIRDSFNDDGEYVPFFSPPPPPLYRHRFGRHPLAPARLPPTPDNASLGDAPLDGVDDEPLPHDALLAMLGSVASGLSSPAASFSSASTLTVSWCSLVGSEGDSGSLGSGPPLALTRRHGVVITELEDDAPISSAPAADAHVVKRSPRLALKESQLYEPVAVCAMKIRGLKDALGACTAALQKQVQKHSVLTSGARPLRKRAVAALTASICASAAPVLDGADD